jgi:hypothetical protein
MRIAKNQANTHPLLLLAAWGLVTGLSACSNSSAENVTVAATSSETGKLLFTANGEEFVRDGLVSKDQWQVSFDHVYVTFDQAIATQQESTEPSENPPTKAVEAVRWDGPKTVDLAGAEPPVIISEVEAPVGQYKTLSWQMSPAKTGPAQGSSILVQGQAQKQDQTLTFALKLDPALEFRCGAYVGDERKGILQPQGRAELEATFHFDHLFGDGTAAPDEALNREALGIEPLLKLAQFNAPKTGSLDIGMEPLLAQLSSEDAAKLREILLNLGHVGEGHCEAKL